MTSDDLIGSLEEAVAASPDDVALRAHLAELLLLAGRRSDVVPHAAHLLHLDPRSAAGRALMLQALDETESASTPPAPAMPSDQPGSGFDWRAAEDELGGLLPPMFAGSSPERSEVGAHDVESAGITLADVGGMEGVKKRLNAAFLAPMRNERLRTMYRKSLRGGLLLYGPPGCGKTYIARALAGELQARFMAVSLADILDMWVGNSERNVHELFETARANAPSVLFLDEVDAIGHKRSRMSSDVMRNTVNQLLLELDSVSDSNDGVFVLAATNHPWDVDAALRRPGRFDRTILVLPPDLEARATIWQMCLRDRPVSGIDVRRLAKLTDGFTGADIAHLCDSAAELALMDAVETGVPRMIGQADVEAALKEVRPSVGPWFETARNVAMFANEDGTYDDLLRYLRKHRRL
ncbi:MAG TPA: ATP-binding protein [Nocardioides sp.]|uniref:ATP-binding protein n=1 Tax=Nocardioides sp. TaxID=35761 RepID=UPI002E36CA56|nr:ATP-binding protein [Nocardioides sp.]HEX5089687.1 ATP-binding protein [Nocardioides sp.]